MASKWEQKKTAIMKDYAAITDKILALNGLKGARLRPLKGGYVNIVLLATKGSTKRVIKISVDDKLQNEVYWYAEAKKANVSTPRLITYNLSEKTVPYKYMISSYIDGKPPSWDSRELQYRAGIFTGKALRKLHGRRVNGFGSLNPDNKWSNKTWIETLRYIRGFAIDDRAALRVLKPRQIELIDNLTIYNKELEVKSARLLHGDLYSQNLLYENKLDRFFIIDPSYYVIAGDPMYDVSYSMVERGKGFNAGVRHGYDIESLAEKELYRLKMLGIFQTFKDMTWYVSNNDSKVEIKKLHKSLLEGLSSI
jgi:fructosamine-3-kinase